MVLKRVPGQEATFTTCMAFAPDGSILASTNSDGSVTLWIRPPGTAGTRWISAHRVSAAWRSRPTVGC